MSNAAVIIIAAGVILAAFIAILIYRGSRAKFREVSGLSGITVRCLISVVEQPIEKILFRCDGEYLSPFSRVACENYLHPISFDEMIRGYREVGNGNKVKRIPLLRHRLSLPKKLRMEHREMVLNALMEARCSTCGRLIQPYCLCQGKNEEHRDHRLDFEYTLSDIIATTGPVAVGQTVYFHMLKLYLENIYTVGYKMQVKLEPFQTRQTINKNLFRIIQERILLPPTYIGELWEFRFTISPNESGWPTQPIKFFMFDTSGSIPTDMNLMNKHFGYAVFSDNLMLFIDPFSIPELAKSCYGFGETEFGGDQNPFIITDILDNIIEFLGQRMYFSIINILSI